MKRVLMIAIFVVASILSNAQIRYTGYLYTLQTGAKEKFEYTASTSFKSDQYVTTYKIFKAGVDKIGTRY